MDHLFNGQFRWNSPEHLSSLREKCRNNRSKRSLAPEESWGTGGYNSSRASEEETGSEKSEGGTGSFNSSRGRGGESETKTGSDNSSGGGGGGSEEETGRHKSRRGESEEETGADMYSEGGVSDLGEVSDNSDRVEGGSEETENSSRGGWEEGFVYSRRDGSLEGSRILVDKARRREPTPPTGKKSTPARKNQSVSIRPEVMALPRDVEWNNLFRRVREIHEKTFGTSLGGKTSFHSCPKCGKGFSRSDNLRRHKLICTHPILS
jgi:hypothetical protein